MRNLCFKRTYRLLWTFFVIIFLTTQLGCKRKIEVKSIERQKIYEKYIDSMLVENVYVNEIDSKKIIVTNEKQFISIVEPILFNIYGKDRIVHERPYEVYFVKNYWIISGRLPKHVAGGTFFAIMDARNCGIIKIEHGE